MKTEIKNEIEFSREESLKQRVAKLKYNFWYDYKQKSGRDNLLLFVMDN